MIHEYCLNVLEGDCYGGCNPEMCERYKPIFIDDCTRDFNSRQIRMSKLSEILKRKLIEQYGRRLK